MKRGKGNLQRLLLVCATVLPGIVGATAIATASQSLPSGGYDFDSAVELTEGDYSGGGMEDGEMEWFYVDGIEPGQELTIKGTFTAASTSYGAGPVLLLFDEDGNELFDGFEAVYTGSETIETSWLSNADETSYRYYIEIGCDTWELATHDLEISITDRFDAGSQTDAGDIFSGAIEVGSGTYSGYLAGEQGSDELDYYKVEIEGGETLAVAATPSGNATLDLSIYDADRDEIAWEYGTNDGEILRIDVEAERNEDLYIAVSCGLFCSDEVAGYELEISGATGTGTTASLASGDDTTASDGSTNQTLIICLVLIIVGGIVAFLAWMTMNKKKDSKEVG